MPKKHYFFDFDETLVDTSELIPYRKTNEGRRHVASNPASVNTVLIDDQLRKLVISLHKSDSVTITTNSPADYTKALLAKHDFPIGIPVFGSLEKPCSEKFKEAVLSRCRITSNAVSIGDSASDVLAAHGFFVPTIAVTWGKTSDLYQLKKSEPAAIVDNYSRLYNAIVAFENGRINYSPRTAPSKYVFIQDFERASNVDPNIEIHSVQSYFPVGHENFRESRSADILRFKEMKNFLTSEIFNDISEKFFYKGEVKNGSTFKHILNFYYRHVIGIIDELNLKGVSCAISAPNSAPEYCYKCDINQVVSWYLNKHKFMIEDSENKRIIFRVFPKGKSHSHAGRSIIEHLRTIGIERVSDLPNGLDNVIIFDDVTTSNAQIKSIGIIVRELFGFKGNLYGIALGETIY